MAKFSSEVIPIQLKTSSFLSAKYFAQPLDDNLACFKRLERPVLFDFLISLLVSGACPG